jgi:hypothetical protein
MSDQGKNKGGRPAKEITEDQMAQVEALGAVLSLEQVADYFGIGKTTFYAIMERQPEVGERYKKGKSRAISDVAQGLLKQARDGNLTAMMFYLKTQAGWRETEPKSEDQESAPPLSISFEVSAPIGPIKTTIGEK